MTERSATGNRHLGRSLLVLLLFGLSVVGGVVAYTQSQPKPVVNPFASIDARVPEPAPAAQIARALATNDPTALATAVPSDLLDPLGKALDPIVSVKDVRYVGGIQKNGTTFAGYVATGKTSSGSDFVVGFVLRVLGNSVAAVN